MDNRNEIREFLASRRARNTRERAGLPAYGGNQRVAGLRREEVALPAAYTAEPGSASEDALNLLASWAATLDQAETAQATTDGA